MVAAAVVRRCSHLAISRARCSLVGPWHTHLPALSGALSFQKTAAVQSIAFPSARGWPIARSMSTIGGCGNHPLVASYNAFCKESGFHHDGAQQGCIQQMMGIYDAVTANPSRIQVSVRRKQAKSKGKKPRPKMGGVVSAPNYPGQRGLYLYGGCGCGKTLLLDLMYRTLLEHNADFPVRRLHWHEFVRDGLGLTKDAPSGVVAFDWLADKMSRECKVLILDELMMIEWYHQAMIVCELFTSLWSRGVVTLVSSNHRPEKLYAGGLNRVAIEPFLRGDLQKQMPLFDFNLSAAGAERFLPTLGDKATRQMDLELEALVGDVAAPLETKVPSENRKLHIQQASSSHGRAEFPALTDFIDIVPRITAEIYQPPAHQLEEMELLGSSASEAGDAIWAWKP